MTRLNFLPTTPPSWNNMHRGLVYDHDHCRQMATGGGFPRLKQSKSETKQRSSNWPRSVSSDKDDSLSLTSFPSDIRINNWVSAWQMFCRHSSSTWLRDWFGRVLQLCSWISGEAAAPEFVQCPVEKFRTGTGKENCKVIVSLGHSALKSLQPPSLCCSSFETMKVIGSGDLDYNFKAFLDIRPPAHPPPPPKKKKWLKTNKSENEIHREGTSDCEKQNPQIRHSRMWKTKTSADKALQNVERKKSTNKALQSVRCSFMTQTNEGRKYLLQVLRQASTCLLAVQDLSDLRPTASVDSRRRKKSKGNPEREREQSLSMDSPPHGEPKQRTPTSLSRTRNTPTAQRDALEKLKQKLTYDEEVGLMCRQICCRSPPPKFLCHPLHLIWFWYSCAHATVSCSGVIHFL